MKFSVNLSMLFAELPFERRFAEAAKCGFSAVEFWFPLEHGGKRLIPIIREAGSQVVLFNLSPGDTRQGEWGTLGIPGREAHFKQAFEQAVDLAVSLGCTKLNALAGIRPESVAWDDCIDAIRRNLEWAATQLPIGIQLLIEALNPIDRSGYLLRTPEQGLELVHELANPSIGLLYDIYHAHQVGSDIIRIIEEELGWLGHIQIADSPNRHEPGTGTIPFDRVFRAVETAGYKGYIGLEYKPSGSTRDALKWCQEWAI
jgi:hydroxypyruvate isomerase